jgi:hypothetical protein
MFINWLLTVFPVEMSNGWRLVSRDLILWLAVAVLSAGSAALSASMHGHAPPAMTILQALAPVLVMFLAAAKFDAAVRSEQVDWRELGSLLASRGIPLLAYAVLATLITRFPQSIAYHATSTLLEGTPLRHAISETFSVVIYISLLARFCFVPFLVVLHGREELPEKLRPSGSLARPAALIWPFPVSDRLSDGIRWRVAPYLALPYLIAIVINLTPGVAQIAALLVGELVKLVTTAVLFHYFAVRRREEFTATAG